MVLKITGHPKASSSASLDACFLIPLKAMDMVRLHSHISSQCLYISIKMYNDLGRHVTSSEPGISELVSTNASVK